MNDYLCTLLTVVTIMHLLITPMHFTAVVNSTNFNALTKSKRTSDKQTEGQNSFTNSLSSSQMCLASDNKDSYIYPNSTFTLLVKGNFSKAASFEIETNLNTYIYQLKEIIQQQTGYHHEEQRLRLISTTYYDSHPKLQDSQKLGDYVTMVNNTCRYILKVNKRKGNKRLIFNLTPNVTHYEYVKMSSHVYQPNEPFLDGWQIKQYHLPNKNGLALVTYINHERHQCVVSIRGTDLTSSFLNNPITDLRLLFTNQAIDTFDSARLLLFHDKLLHIPRKDSTPYAVSFTGHSLGAALAESFACIYKANAVTFDSPGTKHILRNDPSCRTNIELGYNLTEHIHIYLGAYANLINVANPQSGRVTYLKQFGISNDAGSTEFFYIYSSSAGVYIAACIFANIIDRSTFKLGLWFTIGYFIQKSSMIDFLSSLLHLNFEVLSTLNWFIMELPFIITVFLLCQSVSNLADSIERRVYQIRDYLSLENLPLIGGVLAFTGRNINFNRVICRFTLLYIYLLLSFFISIGIPILCYLWWLSSAHSINKFVESFDPDSGKPYKCELIEPVMWPTLLDYVTKIASRQFLLFLLIIQSMKLVSGYLFPQSVPRWFRLNAILMLFVRFFDINSPEYLIFMFTLFLLVFLSIFQKNDQYYVRNVVCATCGLLAIMQIMSERHAINKLHCELVCCPILLLTWFKKLQLF